MIDRRLFVLFMLLLPLVAPGCRDEPDREWANETYAAHKAKIDAVEAQIKAAYDAFAPLPFEQMPAELEARKPIQEAQQARKAAFDQKALQILQAHDDIVGWELTYSFPKEGEATPIRYSFDQASRFTPSYRVGALRADKRPVKVDGRGLSWGLYQIRGKEKKTSLGMEVPSYHKGIEVDMEIPREGSRLDLSLFLAPKDK